nr:TetR/AcrR family transcriptional regulator [Hyphomonas sp. Mor2]
MPQAIRPPKQTRAIRTRRKLIEALERLLRTAEFEHISVQDIAREAGVAVGSVYSHFKDKNAFLEALLTFWREQVEAQLDVAETQDTAAALAALGSLRAALFEAVKSVHQQTRENGHILRAVHTYARLHPEMGDEDWQALVVRSFKPIGAFMAAYADEITVTDPDLATRILGFFFNTIFIRSALMPQDTLLEAIEVEDETLVHEATEMLFAYLTLPR